MLTDLRAALAAGEWVRALGLALDAWRSTRAPALADLVDVIGARCKEPRVPKRIKVLHGWWLARASLHDPADLDALLEAVPRFAYSHDTDWKAIQARWVNRTNRVMAAILRDPRGNLWNRDLLERIAELVDWPEDPRVARVLAQYFLFADQYVRWLEPTTATWVTHAVVDRIGEIGDLRVLDDIAVRAKHQTLVVRIREMFARIGPPRDPGPLLGECMALARPKPGPAPVRRPDLDDLWRAVAANPDIATRAVLGDALVESGDLRGDLIVLQCNARKPNRPLRARANDQYDGRAKTLIRTQWRKWLGPLADILMKDGTVFRCGMLEVARVGRGNTPESAWAAIRGHRELCAIHTVRPGFLAPARLAEFILALPRDPVRLVAHDPWVLHELAKTRARMATTRLDCVGWGDPPYPSRQLPEVLDVVQKLCPDVVELGLDLAPGSAHATRVVELRERFPKLEHLRITSQTLAPRTADERWHTHSWIEVVSRIDESG